MQNLGLWGMFRIYYNKQHEKAFWVVKSYKMWVSGGRGWGGSIYIYILHYVYKLHVYMYYKYTCILHILSHTTFCVIHYRIYVV